MREWLFDSLKGFRLSPNVIALGLFLLTTPILVGPTAAQQSSNSGNNSGGVATGNSGLAAAIQPLVLVSGLEDINLGKWSGKGSMLGGDGLCIWSSTRGYALEAVGSGEDGSFEMTNRETDQTIGYTVAWSDINRKNQRIVPRRPLVGQTTSAATQDCQGGETARVTVDISERDLAAHGGAGYRGTLLLVIRSE